MKIRNKRSRPVVIAPAGRDPISVEADATVEVDDDLGKSLLEQPDRWEAVTTKPKKAAKSGEED